jgi:hypothetical protein
MQQSFWSEMWHVLRFVEEWPYIIVITAWTRANFMNVSKNYMDGRRVFVHGAFSWLSGTLIVEVKGQVCLCVLDNRIISIDKMASGKGRNTGVINSLIWLNQEAQFHWTKSIERQTRWCFSTCHNDIRVIGLLAFL